MNAAEELVGAGVLLVEEAVQFSAISQTVLYELMRTGQVAYGRRDDVARRYIPRVELVQLLASHLVSERPLTSAERVELCAEGACSVGEAATEGPFGRTTIFKLIKTGTLPAVKVAGCDPTIPGSRCGGWRRPASSRRGRPSGAHAGGRRRPGRAGARARFAGGDVGAAVAARLRDLKAEHGAAEFARMVKVGKSGG